MARLLGFESRIFVPRGTALARIQAIESEGATCTVVDGDYDAAIARSAEEVSERCLIIDDTSWPGYEEIPRWVIQGYGTIFREVEEQIDSPPGAVFVPIGVGALGAAAVDFYKRTSDAFVMGRAQERGLRSRVDRGRKARDRSRSPGLSWPASTAGRRPRSPSPRFSRDSTRPSRSTTPMPRKRCGLSRVADRLGRDRGRGLAGLEAFRATGSDGDSKRVGLDRNATVLLLVTEGATDPERLREDRGMKLRFGLLAIQSSPRGGLSGYQISRL
jgi:diaminopropionate ammonia-lyase